MSRTPPRQIEIRLQRLEQLVDSLDPSPFHEQALDRHAEAYLIDCVGEHPAEAELQILVHAPEPLCRRHADIAAAIHAHFRLLHAQALRRHLRRRRTARFAIVLGLSVLVGALALRGLLSAGGGPVAEVLGEGLLILAWVALWRPLEMALFERWEAHDQLRVLATLARIGVELRPLPTP